MGLLLTYLPICYMTAEPKWGTLPRVPICQCFGFGWNYTHLGIRMRIPTYLCTDASTARTLALDLTGTWMN